MTSEAAPSSPRPLSGPMKLITVYMPTCNRRQLVERAVESVLQQTYANLELIVVDDGSKDGTQAYLAEVASRDHRVKFFANETSLGACASRNRAILAGRGQFATGLDDDDFLLPDHLVTLMATYEKLAVSGKKIAVFPQTITRTARGDLVRKHQLEVVRASDLLRSNWIGNQIFAERDAFLASGMFDVQMPAWQDYDMWARMAGVVDAFYRADHATYLQDESHDSNRTTAKHAAVINKAYSRFVAKHLADSSNRARLILRVNYHSYPQVPLSVAELAEYFLHGIYVKPFFHFVKKRMG